MGGCRCSRDRKLLYAWFWHSAYYGAKLIFFIVVPILYQLSGVTITDLSLVTNPGPKKVTFSIGQIDAAFGINSCDVADQNN